MKTLLLSLILLAGITTGFAQTTSGNFLLGGRVNFESVKSNSAYSGLNQSTNFFFSPNIGYFIVNNIAGGVRVDVGSYLSKTEALQTKSNTMTLSPFLRCYFLPVQNKVNVFIDAGYLHNRTRWRSLPNEGNVQKSYGYSIMAGPAVFISKQVALEFTVGFKHLQSNSFEATRTNTFNSGVGLQIHFGKAKLPST